jgi:hypothetical protein
MFIDRHGDPMAWRVQFHADFAREADELAEALRVELRASIRLLEHLGPSLGRPTADTTVRSTRT